MDHDRAGDHSDAVRPGPRGKKAASLLPEPSFLDEDHAPPVDRDVLLALVHHALPEDQSRRVFALVSSYRSWSTCYWDMVASEYVRTGGKIMARSELAEVSDKTIAELMGAAD